MVGTGPRINLLHQIGRQTDIETHWLGFDTAQINLSQQPNTTLVVGVMGQLLQRRGRRHRLRFTMKMGFDCFLNRRWQTGPIVSRRKAARKVGKSDAVGLLVIA